MAKPKKKVAILGGGLAALTAAYELTDYPGWEKDYDITLYQIGWRLGGKTSCGRGPAQRIEEMGIHIFQGWYNNAFRMMQTAFDYLKENGLSGNNAFQTWKDAYVPDNATLFTEFNEEKQEWTNWPVVFPVNNKIPGEGGPPPLTVMLKEGIGLILELLLNSPYQPRTGCAKPIGKIMQKLFFSNQFTPAEGDEEWMKHAGNEALKKQGHRNVAPEVMLLHHAHELAGKMHKEKTQKIGGFEIATFRVLVHLMKAAGDGMKKIWGNRINEDPKLHRLYTIIEFGYANMKGLLEDVYDEKTHTFKFSNINDYDYREWLTKNGAPKAVLHSGPTNFIYCGCFHNQYKGEPGKLAADMGLRSLIVSVNYRGNLVWKLKGGTGGSLTAPLYKVLKHRGIKFKFFNKVEKIHYSKTKEIESMTIGEQVPLKKGIDDYDPLIDVHLPDGKVLNDWPAEPLYNQLDPDVVKRLKEKEIDLESSWADWNDYEKNTLKKGDDFDEIILGIPVLALKHICSEIADKDDDWKNMVDKVATTPTLQVQTWLKPNLAEMGMDVQQWGMEKGDEPNSVIYADLLYSWTDMSIVMPFEGWAEDNKPKHLSYFCGTWPVKELAPFSDHDFPKNQLKELKDYSADWLHKEMGWLWPKATTPEFPKGLDFNLLVDPGNPSETSGTAKYDKQYFRINVDPSYHYTLARPGTDKYRLAPDNSHFDNLFLTGDWTNFGFNIGHVEGTVTSGLKAAQALRIKMGYTENKEIYTAVGE
jgi:uncharacterized protein with NAD-binding domain and iron-sulfur cluster